MQEPTVGQKRDIITRFFTSEDEIVGPPISVPLDISVIQLSELLNKHVLKNSQKLPYTFFLDDIEIQKTLEDALQQHGSKDCDESILKITFKPQAIFKVRCITRCSSTFQGHTEPVLCVSFNPNGSRLASGSGDGIIRLWEMDTDTSYGECKGHGGWILCIRWSPNGKKIVSGSMDKSIKLWDPIDGKLISSFVGHNKYITCIDWEPLHVNPHCTRFASSSKDCTARIWTIGSKLCQFSLTGHTASITCLKWGGEGLIYTASQDRTIKVWSAENGSPIRTLSGHGHWVNSLSLNTDHVLRSGSTSHTCIDYDDEKESQRIASQRWSKVKGRQPERLVSGSDDTTVCLWEPSRSEKPIAKLSGHARLVNVVSWSPDGTCFISGSFDKTIKLWNRNGKLIGTFRGHVGELYQISWSSDSRLFASGSKDSTLKVWEISTRKLKEELPGHADEIYAVDWSPDGSRLASGSKDRTLKLWRS